MLVITPLLAAALAAQQLRLAFGIVDLRRAKRISLGDGDDETLRRTTRAFGNLTEYAPLMLVLLACLELNLAPWWLTASLALPFLAGRVLHPIGLVNTAGASTGRVLGMHLTLWPIAVAALANLAWVFVG